MQTIIQRIQIMFTRNQILLLLGLLTILTYSHIPHYNKDQIAKKLGETPVMYGSAVRVRGIASGHHLHSHQVRYPRGSGYQSVTGMGYNNDYNSLWTIKEEHADPVKTYDQQVKCGDIVRLEHSLTKRNLHSEEIYMSMITGSQEVSAYGQSGFGDQKDNWIISCTNGKKGDGLQGSHTFELIHEETDKHLKISRYYKYSFSNWQNCPCDGQLQVSAADSSTKQTIFQIVGGVFFKETNKPEASKSTNEQDGQL